MNKKKLILSPLLSKRINKFIRIKRGFYSLILILSLYFLSFFSEFFINGKALFAKYDNKIYFSTYSSVKLKKAIIKKSIIARKEYFHLKKMKDDGEYVNTEKLLSLKKEFMSMQQLRNSLNSHRKLKEIFKKQNQGDWLLLTVYPYGPNDILLDELTAKPPTKPSSKHIMGTDDRGRDVFARLVYGFRISMSFGLIYTFVCYIIGIIFGAIVGFYGGKIDFFGMRIIEIWSSMPFLYMVMILTSILVPNFMFLIIILSLFSWMGITWYVRAEFLREKSKDYVQAAIAIGASDFKILFKHILPNALTPLVAFLPFTVIGGISSLVSLDFLSFGLPVPTPSWGELLNQGVKYILYGYWWLVFAPVGALFFTLLIITFIGEAVREAFDPKEFSRLR